MGLCSNPRVQFLRSQGLLVGHVERYGCTHIRLRGVPCVRMLELIKGGQSK